MVLAAVFGSNIPLKPKSAEDIQARLTRSVAILNFIEAEIIVKNFLNMEPPRGPHAVLDAAATCNPVGNGVWYAKGSFAVLTSAGPMHLGTWQLLFKPEAHTPIYIYSEDKQWGNLKEALRTAGLPPPPAKDKGEK